MTMGRTVRPGEPDRRVAGSAPAAATPDRAKIEAIKAAFAANDLGRILGAIDKAIKRRGPTQVALESKVERSTLFRAFRQQNGPALDTLVSVLHTLGCRLIVETGHAVLSEQPHLDAKDVARLLTKGFRSGDLDLAVAALATALRSQQNISEFVRTTSISRENLYRAFAFPRIPRCRTVLIFLNALGLQFGIESLPVIDATSSQRPARRHSGTK